jgi:hypothetical protein
MADHPIEGQLLLAAGARASVALHRVDGLVERAQDHVVANRETYERTYERIEGARDADFYCVETGFWERVGEELGLDRREADAVRRAHEAQFTRDGRRLDRESEFETTLEVREVVAVAATR